MGWAGSNAPRKGHGTGHLKETRSGSRDRAGQRAKSAGRARGLNTPAPLPSLVLCFTAVYRELSLLSILFLSSDIILPMKSETSSIHEVGSPIRS